MKESATAIESGDSLLDPRLKELYAYWNARRGDRRMPRRSDIDPPLDLRHLLGRLLLADVVRPGNAMPARFRFRLVGSELAQEASVDMTGRWLEEFPHAVYREYMTVNYGIVAATGQPRRTLRHFVADDRVWSYEALVLPLGHDNLVDMLLAGVMPRSEAAGSALE